ncbi:hypothetical protein EON62_06330, partial [archaeon]
AALISASQFWPDCIRYKATCAQYIGELCRYMVQSPSHPQEARHKVRLALGNGMRPDVWPVFQARFAIPLVVEFYASTEGNASLANYCSDDSYRGAVGRMGWLARKSGLVRIVKFDEESGACAHTGVVGWEHARYARTALRRQRLRAHTCACARAYLLMTAARTCRNDCARQGWLCDRVRGRGGG